MIILLSVLGIVIAALCLVSVLVLKEDFKYYKRIYNCLPQFEFYVLSDQLRRQIYVKGEDFIWFVEDNDFLLSRYHYLHNASFTYFNPYSLFWLIKFKIWFKQNVDPKTVPVKSIYI